MVDPRNDDDAVRRAAELCLQKCGDGLTPEESDELGELLSASEAARTEYWRWIALHTELQWKLGAKDELAGIAPRPQVGVLQGPHQAMVRRIGTSLMAWAAIAACLLFVAVPVGIHAWRQNQPIAQLAKSTDEDLRTLVTLGELAPLTKQSSWSFGRPGAKNTTTVFEGDTVCLDEGALELRLTTNTVAVLEAPAIVQTVSADRFRLIRGSVKVDVAKRAEGFSVETESAEVIDLGTVFSVNVDGGATDLVVFDGEVDLKVAGRADQPDDALKRFTAGEAVQVNENGTLSRIVQVQQSSVAARKAEATRDPIIAAVRDDNVREDFWRFYEIVPGGMGEDAAAFVDRPHQWNGADRAGMPAYLVGGDYVKTFNDDKVTRDMSVELTLDRPATLYVLLDSRVTPPDWLLEGFADTGDVIGVDEVHRPYDDWKSRPGQLGVGAEVSVNRQHSIWKRVVAEAGVVTLGANGDVTDKSLSGVDAFANMYGVVAVPLPQ